MPEDKGFEFRKWNAILRLKYGIKDPDNLPLKDWAKLVEEYRYIYELEAEDRKAELETLEINIKNTLYHIVNTLYGKN
ncbi:hypothetical protein ETU08_01760 [Apibacter muscae]|uniref:Uncharacterized protein n=1 Tax=Apibacter muscae TaxID=2509004 RepID=A0A563DK09_9FLAO|nr:hypothetical protein [Apibacter muscae]TWP23530.1 hypothetical protein ETU10_07340 [Apibacter muscae]TWP30510.1 hypothetical protein ETU09_00485 [Apibacter muscae]TWP31231.1 hypothetical protein ETU08_01760 [Apibacter muscae]